MVALVSLAPKVCVVALPEPLVLVVGAHPASKVMLNTVVINSLIIFHTLSFVLSSMWNYCLLAKC